jgi:RNA polymerase sigma-70 factor (ECF subfamily)
MSCRAAAARRPQIVGIAELAACAALAPALLFSNAGGRHPMLQLITNIQSTPRRSEADLVAALRRGADASYERLVREQGGAMLAVARRYMRSEDDARDIVQEALLAVFRGIASFSADAKLSTWLHRIVVNCALMRLRSRRRRPEQSLDDLLPRFDAQGAFADGVAELDVPAAETVVERRQTRQAVRRCIDRLPESYRTLLMLRDIEERDTEETAVLLDLTVSAVKSRLHRARQVLRELLVAELGDEAGGEARAAG